MQAAILILSYLLGAFPTGTIVAKIYGVNLKQVGSGSTGATNVARALGKTPGIITLLIDISKGVAAVMLARHFSNNEALWLSAGFFAVLGHCFSLPGILKGGKGVATAIGTIAAFSPALALLTLVTFAVTFFLSRIVSLSSICASLVLFIYALFLVFNQPQYLALLSTCLLVVIRHKDNIRRLRAGEEKTFSSAKRN